VPPLVQPWDRAQTSIGETAIPRVLFVNSNYEDYLADSVFHGLRTLIGENVIEFPKAEYMYTDASGGIWSRARAGGFTLYGLLPDLPLDRDRVFQRALDGEFDLVVFGAIWAQFGVWSQWGPLLHRRGIALAVLDGADAPKPYPYSWLWWRKPYWWTLPRAHKRTAYFKREITPKTRWFASYLLLPPALGRSLNVKPIAFSIPAEKILPDPPAKEKDFPLHIVDSEVATNVGAQVDLVFDQEQDYYEDLRTSRFGVTTKRAGWDALRHYEIAANGAVPCFRDLDRKPKTCAPFGLDRKNALIYRDADDLLDQISALDDNRYSELQAGAMTWARANTTLVRAEEFLTSCGLAVRP
jgi:hypothetical protein